MLKVECFFKEVLITLIDAIYVLLYRPCKRRCRSLKQARTTDINRIVSQKLDELKRSIIKQLYSIFPWLKTHNNQEVTRSKSSAFTRLPIVILQLVAAELPASAKAALALTSKSLHAAVGNLSWTALSRKENSSERRQFLSLLERDTAAFLWLCTSCAVLHRKPALPPSVDESPHFRHCDRFGVAQAQLFRFEFASFCWAHAHLVMQRHCRGKEYGLPIEAFNSCKGWRPRRYLKTVCKFSTHGKVCDDEVFVKATLLVDASLDDGERSYYFRICGHLRMPFAADLSKTEIAFRDLLSCRLSHLGTKVTSCSSCAPRTRRCEWCAVEYDLTASRSALFGPCLLLTVWANLGPCPDLKDPRWTNSFSTKYEREVLQYDVGAIRAKYECG